MEIPTEEDAEYTKSDNTSRFATTVIETDIDNIQNEVDETIARLNERREKRCGQVFSMDE